MSRDETRARDAIASSLAAKGPAWSNAAASIRAGFTNCWIEAAVTALTGVLRLVPDEDEDDHPQARRA